MADAETSLPAKRKRPQISYTEPNDEVLDFISIGDSDSDSAGNELPDDDSEYGSRKVTCIQYSSRDTTFFWRSAEVQQA